MKAKTSEKVRNNKNTINQENGQDKTHITVAKIIPVRKTEGKYEETNDRARERHGVPESLCRPGSQNPFSGGGTGGWKRPAKQSAVRLAPPNYWGKPTRSGGQPTENKKSLHIRQIHDT